MTVPEQRTIAPAKDGGVATALRPLVEAFVGDAPVRVEFWDGSSIGDADTPGALRLTSPDAIKRLLWSPDELGLSRAYVAGALSFDGDIYHLLTTLRTGYANAAGVVKSVPATLRSARRLGLLGRPLPPPPEEARPRGRRHSKRRDAEAITHHYDVDNDFYRLVLGPTMTYSCAYFADATTSLDDAQVGKQDLVLRKLGLHQRAGMRLLDVGCGWGSLVMRAAQEYDAHAVGVTISKEQAELATARVAAAGLSDRVEIRLQDYRDLGGEQFDAVSSIGMFEHVGKTATAEYFTQLRSLLRPQGRLLNHAISSVGGSKIGRRSFMYRYVFPDGELLDVGDVVLAMESAGFEVRDVESLREHYALTLREWVKNLEANWDAAVQLVGETRARIWRLYMAASAIGFEDGGISVHQVLGVVPDSSDASGFPLTRRAQFGG